MEVPERGRGGAETGLEETGPAVSEEGGVSSGRR